MTSVLRAALQRLRSDIKLSILMLLGACAMLGILPFAFYRFASGNLVMGLIDTLLVLTLAASAVIAWRTGDTRASGLFLVIGTTIGGTAGAMLLGVTGLFWMYAVFVASFFLVSSRIAATTTTLALLVLVIGGRAFDSNQQLVSFVVTSIVVSLFAFIVSQRTETQRVQLQVLVSHDPLTGLQNRRAMERELPIAVESHRRQAMQFGLIVIDLDHFKRVNDEQGHEAGDRALKEFAELIRSSTREIDRIFRFGGEEFALLLPDADQTTLPAIAEKLRCTTAAHFEKIPPGLTISLGAAALEDGEDWPHWLARADAALYRAKDRGRNCAVVD